MGKGPRRNRALFPALVQLRLELDQLMPSPALDHIPHIPSYMVWTSVASPASPMYTFSVTGKALGNWLETVRAWAPSRLSVPMATQFLPTMATTAPPLYSMMLCRKHMRKGTQGSTIAGIESVADWGCEIQRRFFNSAADRRTAR